MKLLLLLSLGLLAIQPRRGDLPSVNQHWCEQPVHKLKWLKQMIQNAQSWPAYHYGWEVHQAQYQGQEVFVLHLCRYCGQNRGFLLYSHYGELIGRGEGADSTWITKLPRNRLLAAHPGRFMAVR